MTDERGSSPTVREGCGIVAQALPHGRATAPVDVASRRVGARFADAWLKYSGRVGRSAGAKRFEEDMVRLAVMAHVRHRETNYDSLLAKGWFRNEARAQVRDRVEAVLEKWRG